MFDILTASSDGVNIVDHQSLVDDAHMAADALVFFLVVAAIIVLFVLVVPAGCRVAINMTDEDSPRANLGHVVMSSLAMILLVVLAMSEFRHITNDERDQDAYRVGLVSQWAQSRGLTMSDRDAKHVVDEAQEEFPEPVAVYFTDDDGQVVRHLVAYNSSDELLLVGFDF